MHVWNLIKLGQQNSKFLVKVTLIASSEVQDLKFHCSSNESILITKLISENYFSCPILKKWGQTNLGCKSTVPFTSQSSSSRLLRPSSCTSVSSRTSPPRHRITSQQQLSKIRLTCLLNLIKLTITKWRVQRMVGVATMLWIKVKTAGSRSSFDRLSAGLCADSWCNAACCPWKNCCKVFYTQMLWKFATRFYLFILEF